MKTAVILAAGLGSRIDLKIPKGFIKIGGLTLIERSLDCLKSIGISEVFIGTGFEARHYERLSKEYPINIHCIKNEAYADSGSLYTLFNMREYIRDDFLLLESDLIYEQRGLEALLEGSNKNVILASGETNSGDEVYIDADEGHNLTDMSKSNEALGSVYAELVGITRLSIDAFRLLCDLAETNLSRDKRIEYETGIVNLSKKLPVYVHKIDDLMWAEIDNEEHMERAKKKWALL